MIIGNRLRSLRKQKKLSQGDIQQRTGFFRTNISKIERGHKSPSIQTLERLARALEVPLYRFFYDIKEPPAFVENSTADANWGSSGKDAIILAKFRRLFSKMKEDDLRQFLLVAHRFSLRNAPKRYPRKN